jgi:hypothetical protein
MVTLLIILAVSCGQIATNNTDQQMLGNGYYGLPRLDFVSDKFTDISSGDGIKYIWEGHVETRLMDVTINSDTTIIICNTKDCTKYRYAEFYGNVFMTKKDAHLLEITSKKAYSDNLKKYITFEGNVEIKKNGLVSNAERYIFTFANRQIE